MTFELKSNALYRMPAHFGPSAGHGKVRTARRLTGPIRHAGKQSVSVFSAIKFTPVTGSRNVIEKVW